MVGTANELNRQSENHIRPNKRLTGLASLVPFLLLLVQATSTLAQPSGTAEYRDYGVRFAIVDGVVRPEVYWTIYFDVSHATVILSVTHVHNTRVSQAIFIQSVEPGDSRNGNLLDLFSTTGDLVQYLLSMSPSSGAAAVDVVGESSSDRKRVPGPPTAAPPNLATTETQSFSDQSPTLRLTWDEITGDVPTGYTEITGYDIHYRFQDAGDWVPVSPAPTDASRQYDHVLTPEQTRQGAIGYRIRATNEITELENGPQGPWSDEVTVTSVDAPQNLTATLQANGDVVLAWEKASNDDGTTITVTGYRVHQHVQGETAEKVKEAPASESPSYTWPAAEVEPGVVYSWFVVGISTDAPLAKASESVTASNPILDINADGSVGADDVLILYYSIEHQAILAAGIDRSNGTAGPLLHTFLGRLVNLGTRGTDAEVLAAWDRARAFVQFGSNLIGGINTTPGIDADDALILYYAAAFRDLLGDGDRGGFESMRSALLTVPSGLTAPTDVPLKAVLQSANEFLARYR